ncbi:unnamed protein product [Rotaria magnacalcarata]|uniref:NAD(P)(+)--arginine ADP-ribosyltransferase n=1 Tax=Rotaria magnacalcarata TaxID=392030 RepID=A0A814EZ00_9BILA|nr:unnamed protein product [Rotaria magnacalcarata]CAF1431741.1 unnamed protein product [Rotaria magnacalcarata]CAF1924227.1 unnamed protein product [Rotaria magnacalcarata]
MEEGPLYFYYRNQPFGEFSNFYPSPIELDGYTWSTTEHYFQAQKFISDETHFQNVLHLRKPIEALFYSRKHRSAVRSDWAQVKDGIMLKACMAKFEQHFRLQELLLSTGNRQLVEHTTKDSYWADGGDGSGRNQLGITLMQAADGIIREGKRLNKPIEAEWLSSQLITVKPFGANLDARQSAHIRIPSEISQTCVYLYTKESFWYTLFNYTLREVIVPTCEQLKTFGPFSWLLYCSLCQIKTTKDILTVYRGLNLTDEQRQEFMEDHVVFFAFTSTSTNRVKAEAFGNTLLIIDLNVQHPYYPDQNIWCGSDIAALSVFPGEEEFLLKNKCVLDFVKYEFDTEKSKHILYLRHIKPKIN